MPGSGSSADFVTRAFAGPLAAAGYRLHPLSPASGPDAAAAALDAMDAAVARFHPALLGGVSLGAHVAARWAAGRTAASVAGLLLALPAWTGQPGAVAAASSYAADRVDTLGTAGALAEAAASAEPWVAAELAAAWPAYGSRLAATLRATAASAGPSTGDLRRIPVPTGIVAFAGDPLHPLPVAREWAALIPRAHLSTLALAAPARDRAVLGATALAAWHTARRGGRPAGHATDQRFG
jgi:pimeloyl-ACP methyl ester carboxylesterase